jgi:hypothetical protein
MLVQLSIRDIVLIDKLDLAFDRGLTILTGETGAGKRANRRGSKMRGRKLRTCATPPPS